MFFVYEYDLSGYLRDSLYPFITWLTCFSVILAADQSNARSILLYQTNLDKVKKLSSHSAMGVSGPNCDSVNFTEYVTLGVIILALSTRSIELALTYHTFAYPPTSLLQIH